MKKEITLILAALFAVISAPAGAGSSVTNFQTTATANSYCTLNANNMSFGNMPFGTRVWVTSSMNVLCSNNTSYSIAINFGHVDASQPQDGDLVGNVSGDLIDYSVTSTPNGSAKWGYSSPVTGKGTGAVQNIPMYGVAITGLYGKPLYPTPDNYSDTATIVVSY
ncbi:TPA: spore coat protein U domain-containing protein [Burkholderia vietnamiensis]|nr:spore coat protein U domain-containing protein [Burkholderia vietnamiensis]